jgi:hypothetical protein
LEQETVVLDATTAVADTEEILKLHSIPAQISADMLDLLEKHSPPAPQNGAAQELSPA